MDSCSSWSPPSLSAEALPALDLILPSVVQESKRDFCAKEQERDDDGDGFSSCLLFHDSKKLEQEGDDGGDGFSSCLLFHDSKKLAQEEAFSLPSPVESTDGCRVGHVKRAKLGQYGAAPKVQLSQSQVPKLGEKITALQQLVSPFGKTDTASVLLEAIGYIKFLQDQVHVLSSPYMKANAGNSGKDCALGTDLRSRGLCLVPVSCTMNVAANSNGADYWISGISGCSR